MRYFYSMKNRLIKYVLLSFMFIAAQEIINAQNHSLNFDGDGDYVDLSYTDGQIESEMSISAWVNLNSNSTGGHIIFNGFGGSDANWYWGCNLRIVMLEEEYSQRSYFVPTRINGAGYKPHPNNGIIDPSLDGVMSP